MKKTHLILLIVSLVAVSTITALWTVRAQEVDSLAAPTTPNIMDEMPNATIIQDSAITRLMHDKIHGITHGKKEMPGWRVQVYSSNKQIIAKQEAETLKAQLEPELEEPVYIQSVQPMWKVRIGNFLSQEEALVYRDSLIKRYPELQSEAYPVRDQIEIEQ